MHIVSTRSIFKRLLAKPVPESYSLSPPPELLKTYDWLIVSGATTNHSDVQFRSFNPDMNMVSYLFWTTDTPGVRAQIGECTFEDVLLESLTVTHVFRSWNVSYESLREAYFYDVFRIQRIKWFAQLVADSLIRPLKPGHRIRLLREIVNTHQAQQAIRIDDLMVKIYGKGVRLSRERYRYQQAIEFILESLVVTNDIVRRANSGDVWFAMNDSFVMPTPRALVTLANEENERRRHNDSISLARCQLFLGLGMLGLAAATLLVEVVAR